jgi:hypothetical protein
MRERWSNIETLDIRCVLTDEYTLRFRGVVANGSAPDCDAAVPSSDPAPGQSTAYSVTA